MTPRHVPRRWGSMWWYRETFPGGIMSNAEVTVFTAVVAALTSLLLAGVFSLFPVVSRQLSNGYTYAFA